MGIELELPATPNPDQHLDDSKKGKSQADLAAEFAAQGAANDKTQIEEALTEGIIPDSVQEKLVKDLLHRYAKELNGKIVNFLPKEPKMNGVNYIDRLQIIPFLSSQGNLSYKIESASKDLTIILDGETGTILTATLNVKGKKVVFESDDEENLIPKDTKNPLLNTQSLQEILKKLLDWKNQIPEMGL